MSNKGLSGELYRPLTSRQVEKIHNRALDLLRQLA